ncbi:GntR family transcriptional regulator [soil metagenome]|jgi:GntR family transcriptional regulator
MTALWLKVDTRSGVPIYVQIVDQVQHAVEVGSLEAGDRLPTVRALAKELTVAPNTIVKAYNELQRSGLIESRPGIGTVVTENVGDVARERRMEALNERLAVLARDAVGLGLTEDDLWERFDAEFERMSSQASRG